ncbi:MAG: NADP-dependent oxidoreductase [Chloroflexi bacterium]|nr:NADP-dependent oxidoreductase [Chloroflexota bacterium]
MSNVTMQAVLYNDYGGPEQLVLGPTPRPEVRPGAVLVRVKAAGVNPWDWKMRSGMYRQFMPAQFPVTPGIELAGIVEEIGPGVTDLHKGQAVYGTGSGTNAEYAVVLATALAPKPGSLSFDQAAAVPVGALTAWRAFERADLKAGQRVLVLGAAGGVGIFAIQLARWKQARVVGTASANNHDFVRSLGAESVVDYQTHAVESAVHDIDLVIDTVGGDTGVRSLQTLRRGGQYITVAGQPPEEEAKERGLKADGVGSSDPAGDGGKLREITNLIESGKIKVQVTNVFPIADAKKAHALGETGHGRGFSRGPDQSTIHRASERRFSVNGLRRTGPRPIPPLSVRELVK